MSSPQDAPNVHQDTSEATLQSTELDGACRVCKVFQFSQK